MESIADGACLFGLDSTAVTSFSQDPVLFDRHAVGGEYGAGWKAVGSGGRDRVAS